MKQVLLPIFGVMIFIALVGFYVQKTGVFNLGGTSQTPNTTLKTVTIGKSTISVTLADNTNKRRQGLSGVSNLEKNSGMLFIFDSKDTQPGFWMKDMLIPLDMIWINDNKIVKIDKNIGFPKPGTPDNKLMIYMPGQDIDYVLEVNANFADSNNIKVGDTVNLDSI